jgi:hypothetical protein
LATKRRETGLRRIVLLLSSVGLLLTLTGPALANQPADHFTEDVTGDTFQCDTAVYTVTSGTISTVVHEGAAASGNLNFTVTITPRKVVAVDEAGNQYSIVGAVWFGGTINANTGGEQFTATQKLQIVSKGGGTVDSVNLTFHVTAQPNNIVVKDFDFGTCAPPE